jgi:gliding motility-associated-like protein
MRSHLTIICLFISFLGPKGFCQNININSISSVRQPSGDNGYTLDGFRMTEGSRPKLLNPGNFGVNGTYPHVISISDNYGNSGSLTQVYSIPTNSIFFFGSFDKNDTSTQQFTNDEIDSLYNWSIRGGKVIITTQSSSFGYDYTRLNSKWRFSTNHSNPSSFIPTADGKNTEIFTGPFGIVTTASEGGSLQGFFDTMPPNSKILATNGNGYPTLIMDCQTLDLIVADVDGYTALGGISPGPTINNSQDKFWANTIVFMDNLEHRPVITKRGFDLSTGTFSAYQWYLDGAPINGANNQSYTVSKNGIYSVETTLICGRKLMSDTVAIANYQNIPNNYFLPTAFSPNQDGLNDILYVHGSGIRNIALSIYNRWGEKVFESHNISGGWDGTFKGKPLDSAVFVYYLEVTFTNGDHATNKGNVTLIR